MLLNTNFTGNPTAWFVADAGLRNTGNVGALLNVKAVFEQAGSGPIVYVIKRVKLPYHGHHTVHIKRGVSQGVVDAYQSSPGYFNQHSCSVQATIVGTYGPTH
jgi:hypothetical protein